MSARRSSRIEKDAGSPFHHPKREKLDSEPTKKAATCIPCRTQKKKCKPANTISRDLISIGDGNEPCARCIAKSQECSYVVHVEDKEIQSKISLMHCLTLNLIYKNDL